MIPVAFGIPLTLLLVGLFQENAFGVLGLRCRRVSGGEVIVVSHRRQRVSRVDDRRSASFARRRSSRKEAETRGNLCARRILRDRCTASFVRGDEHVVSH